MNLEYSRFSLALLLSLVVHMLGLTWYYYKPALEPVTAKKTPSLMINVGLQAAIAEAILEPVIQEMQKTKPITPVVTPMVTPKNLVPTFKPVVKKRVEKKPNKKQKLNKKPAQKKVIAKKPTKQVKKLTKEAVKTTQAKPNIKAGARGVNGTKNQINKKNETSQGKQSGGAKTNENQFDFYVRQHLLSKKVTPRIRSRNKKGVVIVEFTIDRNGNMLAHKIAKPSKIREFDRAATKLIRRAAPFPKAPQNVTWNTRNYKIGINYEVR